MSVQIGNGPRKKITSQGMEKNKRKLKSAICKDYRDLGDYKRQKDFLLTKIIIEQTFGGTEFEDALK